jgi:signal transduction histidine kinase/CheY-like chemotaxis protein
MSSFLGFEFRKTISNNNTVKNPSSNNTIDIENEFKIKSLYLAKTAHELKNVFLTISSFIENRDDIPIDNLKNIFNKEVDHDSSLNFLKSLCDFGMNLIFEITEISKNDGKFKTIKEYNQNKLYEEFNLIDALNFCIKIFQSRAIFEKKNIDIKFNFNNISIDKKIKSISEMKLKQVVINLISNSYKFTINGFIELSVEKIDQKLRIKIVDSGIGFNEKAMEKLFQPYYMLENNQFLNKNGSGLGLFICKEILSSNGSEIKFSSERGKGTQFWFDIKDENIIDPSNYLTEGLKIIINQINSGQKDLNPLFKIDKNSSMYIDEEDVLIDDDSYCDNIVKKSTQKFNFKNKLFRKVQSTNTFFLNSNHIRIDSYGNNKYDCKSSIKNENINKKNNIRVVKTLLNANVGKKILRSLSQSEMASSKYDKNLLNMNSKSNLKILICDDDNISVLSIRKLIVKFFEKNNDNFPDIYYVENGIECLNFAYSFLIKGTPINFIIMDMNMPFLNGFITCKLIKNIIEMNDIKIYLQSSQNVNISECGADGFFDKPLSMKALNVIFQNQK